MTAKVDRSATDAKRKPQTNPEPDVEISDDALDQVSGGVSRRGPRMS